MRVSPLGYLEYKLVQKAFHLPTIHLTALSLHALSSTGPTAILELRNVSALFVSAVSS